MVTEMFADGLGRVDFIGGMIRLELVSLDPAETGPARHEVRQRVVMPIEGFLQAHATMGELVSRLIEAGVLRRTDSPAV